MYDSLCGSARYLNASSKQNHAVIATKHYRGTRRGSDGDGRRSNTIVVPQQPLQHRGEERRGGEEGGERNGRFLEWCDLNSFSYATLPTEMSPLLLCFLHHALLFLMYWRLRINST
jgi:hypothetical protein